MTKLKENVLVLFLLGAGQLESLKLNPVQKLNHKIDLHSESKASIDALNKAVSLRDSLLQRSTESDSSSSLAGSGVPILHSVRELMDSTEVRTLNNLINRYDNISQRFKCNVATV